MSGGRGREVLMEEEVHTESPNVNYSGFEDREPPNESMKTGIGFGNISFGIQDGSKCNDYKGNDNSKSNRMICRILEHPQS